jgi:hypothetical protein
LFAVTRTTLVLVLALAAACGKKSGGGPAPDVTGLSAVPANAQVIIGADVAKLAASPLVERAVYQLLLGDPTLAANWKQVREGCKIDLVKQVKQMILVLGPTPAGGRAGTGPALLVATGSIPENDLSDCVGKLVGKGGGGITGTAAAGKTVYQVKDGARVMYFAYGRPDTVVLGTSEAYVVEAINAGKKALEDPELAIYLKNVDQAKPVWAGGRVDPRVKQGLVGVLPGLKAGPTAFVGSIDPTDGVKLELGAIMASSEDAKHLESITNDQKKVIAMWAQAKSLGPMVNAVSIQSASNIVWFRVPLTMDDVNQLLIALDGRSASNQDSPPAGSGSAR